MAYSLEIERLVAHIHELEAALHALLDEQNGPLLLRDASRWEEAVRRAQALLLKERGR